MKINLGVRGHDLQTTTVEALASESKKHGFNHVQLVLKKAFPNYGGFNNKLNTGMMNYFRDELAKKGNRVSIFACYINMANPNEVERRKEIEYFKEHIRYASDLGAKMVGTETGCYKEDYSYTELNHTQEAFETFLSTAKEIVKEAEKYGIFVALEGVVRHIVNTPKKMKKVLEILDSNNVQVILDPINLLTEENHESHIEVVEECFELYGDRINAIHLKDYRIENNKVIELPVGEGIFDYKNFLQIVNKYKPHIDIIVEGYKIGTSQKIIEIVEEACR